MPGQPKHLVLEFNVGTVVPWPIRRPMVGEHGRSEGRKSRGLLPVSPSYALSGERALYWRRWMALQSTEQLIATAHAMVITFTIELKFSVTTRLSVGQF